VARKVVTLLVTTGPVVVTTWTACQPRC
jgi:hypothetical protein